MPGKAGMPRCNRSWTAVAVCFLMAGLGTGCTTVQGYPKTLRPALAAVESGNFDRALQITDKKSKGVSNGPLFKQEYARIASMAGKHDQSQQAFEEVIQNIQKEEMSARVDLGNAAAQASSLLLNDNVIPYMKKMPAYERIFVYQHQALNYLFRKDIEGALVEIRRANSEQQRALDDHHKELVKMQRKADEEKINIQDLNGRLTEAYRTLDEVEAKVKSSFQNAYTFFLSGLAYELRGETNNAYIDYKNALDIFPENPYLQERVFALGEKLQMTDDLDIFTKKYGRKVAFPNMDAPGYGQVVVIVENGLVPERKQIKLMLPVPPYWALVPVAFPYYSTRWEEPSVFSVNDTGTDMGTTAPICYVRALAVKALKEQAFGIAVREVLRAGLKGAASGAARFDDKGNISPIGIAVDIVNFATTQADRRSWLTLPDNVQVMRGAMPAGEHTVRITGAGPGIEMPVTIQDQRITLIRMISIGNTVRAETVAF